VGPGASLDAVVKRKISLQCPCKESNPGRPARSIITILTELIIKLKSIKACNICICVCMYVYMYVCVYMYFDIKPEGIILPLECVTRVSWEELISSCFAKNNLAYRYQIIYPKKVTQLEYNQIFTFSVN
jgi:hypothetical protein